MEWVGLALAVLAAVFGLGWSLAPKRRPGKVVVPDISDLLDAAERDAAEVAQREEAKVSEAVQDEDDPWGKVTDLF